MKPADGEYELWQLSAITPDSLGQHTQLLLRTQA